MAALSSFPLGGDGVIENLFYYLWCKDDESSGPTINIPDTIIYIFCQPAYWYFTSRDGQIKKKNRYNLTSEKILEAFLKKRPLGCDIIAYFLSANKSRRQAKEGKEDTVIEYFDEQGLRAFLNRQQTSNGVLQRFVQPKGNQSSMLRSIWSPKVCLLERRVNVRKLHDTRFDLYERAATYEGAEVNSRAQAVRGHYLPTKVQLLHESIVRHVAEVSFHKFKINRMVLNFKVDAKDQLWLLWCSSLRLEGTGVSAGADGPVNIEMNVKVPNGIKLSAATGFKQPLNLRCTFSCPSCLAAVEAHRRHQVQYKTVIRHFEQILLKFTASPAALRESTRHVGNTGQKKAQRRLPESGGIFEGPQPKLTPDEIHAKKIGLGAHTLADLVAHHHRRMAHLREQAVAGGGSNNNYEMDTDVEIIPPIIRSAHPKLRADDYSRYRRDPLFLFKTVAVCEDCYLAFMDIASAQIEVPLLMPGHQTRYPRPLPSVADLRISRASRAKRERAQLQLAALRAHARDKRLGRTAVRSSSAPLSRSQGRADAVSRASHAGGVHSSSMTPSSAAVLPFEEGLGQPPSFHTFERITEGTVQPLTGSPAMGTEEAEGTAAVEGLSRDSLRGKVLAKASRSSGNALIHMRRRQKAALKAPRKLPKLDRHSGGLGDSSGLGSIAGQTSSLHLHGLEGPQPYKRSHRLTLQRKGGGHHSVLIKPQKRQPVDVQAARSRLLSKLSYRDWKRTQMGLAQQTDNAHADRSGEDETSSASMHRRFLLDTLAQVQNEMNAADNTRGLQGFEDSAVFGDSLAL